MNQQQSQWAKLVLVAMLAVLLPILAGHQSAPQKFGVISPQSPVLNPNWATTAWAVDPANSTGCAADTNNCTSATCGGAGTGIGPCLTWHNINDIKWGCLGSPKGCPRLRQTTTVTFLSSHTDDSDPVYAFPTIENSGSLIIQGNLTASITASFTSVTNWSSACNTSQRVNDTVNVIGVKGALVEDTTKSARLWCNEFSSNHICNTTIPMSNVAALPNSFQTPGLWTTATGGAGGASGLGNTDNYKLYTISNINIAALEPVIDEWSGSTPANGVYGFHFNFFDPSGSIGVNQVRIGPGVQLEEIRSDRIINLSSSVSTNDEGCVNCWINGGITGTKGSTGHFWHVLGGEITSNATISNFTGLGIAIDGFTTFEGTATFPQGVSMGLIQASFSTFTFEGFSTLAAISPGYATVQNGVWFCGGGGATTNIQSGNLRYDSSHGGSAGIIFGSPTLELAGSTTAESHSGTSPVVVTAGITLSTTNLDAAASTTAFGGSAYFRGAFLGSL